MDPIAARSAGPTVLATGLIYGKPSRRFPSGRVCSRTGCGTRLSRYNPSTTCSLHEELH
jgi:hypothetical protein